MKNALGFMPKSLASIFLPRKQKNTPIEVLKSEDHQTLLKHIPKQSLVLICDEHGKEYSSQGIAEYLEKCFSKMPHVTFILGPAYGLSKALLETHDTLALSQMTLQHEIANLVLIEQLYRALTIMRNHPYHL